MTKLRKAISPVLVFIHDSRFIGVMLIMCTVVSIYFANTAAFAESYQNIWEHEWPASVAGLKLPENLGSWINNFLMAFFFLIAGMEIRRELQSGELSSFKKAVLPFGAALGGMVVPALIFIAFNFQTAYIRGWGIPTATDIAFSIGIAALLGKRVPISLKILLMALAIIDDLGAILVIALFYGGHINVFFLICSAVIYGLLLACTYFKLKFGFMQIMLSLLLWLCLFNSGIEAGISGVLVAFGVPAQMLVVIEKALHRYVSFLVLPLFALANTAIVLPSQLTEALNSKVAVGIMLGLVVGKPLGIYLFSRMLVFFKVASLPDGISWKQILGMGSLAGIGFTMSIFTTMLAFNELMVQDIAKVAIIASVIISLVFSVVYFAALGFSLDFKRFTMRFAKSQQKLTVSEF
ncbi:Na+/H+ antiporter NhaA [Pedobacter sp. MW01-1-1]|uniref:Na+/H+ antiporter NhaA n=1 Tax=Pedobacter sp. MW01-1-1 TaxID=3383027 RepID=UPI003FEE49EB